MECKSDWGPVIDCVAKVVRKATKLQKTLLTEINGVKLAIAPNSNVEEEFSFWNKLFNAQVAYDEYKRQEYEKTDEYKQAAIKAEVERAEKQKQFDQYVATLEPIQIKEGLQEDYKKYVLNNMSDGYSKAIVDYAKLWAKMMQKEIAGGKTVAQCAKETSHKADIFGITGNMYGCAVSILANYWQHGEELKEWYNKEYNYAGAGVINPAVLVGERGGKK